MGTTQNLLLQSSPDVAAQNQQTQPMPMNPLTQRAPTQISPQQIQDFHQGLNDYQEDLKKLLRLPEHELTMGKVLGAASDLVTKHSESNGKRGTSAAMVASELASKDFPKEKPNGEKPSGKDLKKYLMAHFVRSTQLQAALTQKAGPPQVPLQDNNTPPTMHLSQTNNAMMGG